jgi:hypothetical protein
MAFNLDQIKKYSAKTEGFKPWAGPDNYRDEPALSTSGMHILTNGRPASAGRQVLSLLCLLEKERKKLEPSSKLINKKSRLKCRD